MAIHAGSLVSAGTVHKDKHRQNDSRTLFAQGVYNALLQNLALYTELELQSGT